MSDISQATGLITFYAQTPEDIAKVAKILNVTSGWVHGIYPADGCLKPVDKMKIRPSIVLDRQMAEVVAEKELHVGYTLPIFGEAVGNFYEGIILEMCEAIATQEDDEAIALCKELKGIEFGVGFDITESNVMADFIAGHKTVIYHKAGTPLLDVEFYSVSNYQSEFNRKNLIDILGYTNKEIANLEKYRGHID